MHNAMVDKQIPESQYMKRHSSVMEAVILKRIVFDLCRIYKIPAAAFNLDARQCYDRMALPIGSLALRHVGVPKIVIKTMFGALRQMKHYTRSGLGNSEICYKGTEEQPLQGGEQGNAGAGPTWTCISIILILIIDNFLVGSAFVSTLTLLIVPLTAIMYVHW